MISPEVMSHIQYMFRQSTGIDVSQYKDEFFVKCIGERMLAVRENDPAAYIRKALAEPDELNVFLETFTVYHSRFMRDSQKYRVLREKVFPETMKKAREAGRPLGIWSAGCAAGEEPYSIAMSACEAFGMEDARRHISITATDINRTLLDKAAGGSYTGIEFCGQEVDAYYRGKYFTVQGETVTVREEIRRMVAFQRHDLIKDRAFPRMDIIFCRNVLIYMKLESVRGIIGGFYDSLTPEGYLFLGNSEMMDDSFYCNFDKIKQHGEYVYKKIARGSDEFLKREQRQKSIRAGLGLP